MPTHSSDDPATRPPGADRSAKGQATLRTWPTRSRPRPIGPQPVETRRAGRFDLADPKGQATAEYALVMLAAAALAGLLLAWAASTDGIGRLLDHVINSIITNAG